MSETRKCEGCDTVFAVPSTYKAKRYCSRACSNRATVDRRAASHKALGKYQPPICPCGQLVAPPDSQTHVYASQKKYCSPECRSTYQGKRQRDPEKWVTKVCRTCTKEFEFRVNSKNAGYFCSNECAAKHTKVKKYYVLRDSDVVLDSSWEGLFYCLLVFLKIPVARIDRSTAIEWQPGHWYAPDFQVDQIAVEVKGLEDDEDPDKWIAWRNQVGPLVIVDRFLLDLLRHCDDAEQALDLLSQNV